MNYDQQYIAKAVAGFVFLQKFSKLTLAGESIGGILCAELVTMLPKKGERIFVINPYDCDTFFGEGVCWTNQFARFIIWCMSLLIVGSLFTCVENKLDL